jgi:AcrR family transcriptional regulator
MQSIKSLNPPATRRRRGRPPGLTAQGSDARRKLYETAVAMIAERGFDQTTLRDVAKAAHVSPGLLYRYFPSKRSVVLALYEELSVDYATRAEDMPHGKWRDRFLFALTTSLEVLAPHRRTIAALVPSLLDPVEGLFSAASSASRQRVSRVFGLAMTGASDAPAPKLAEAMGRLLYLGHLAVLLWWLLDKSPGQRATAGLLELVRKTLPPASVLIRLPWVRSVIATGAQLVQEGLFDSRTAGEAT